MLLNKTQQHEKPQSKHTRSQRLDLTGFCVGECNRTCVVFLECALPKPELRVAL